MRDIILKIFFICLALFITFMAGRMFETGSASGSHYKLVNMGVGTRNANHVLEVEYVDGGVYSSEYWRCIATLAPHYEHVRLVSP